MASPSSPASAPGAFNASDTPEAPAQTYHHGNLRQALLAACLVALDAPDASLGTISLRELARRVGVSANAAYRHFASKEDLLQAAAAEGFRRLATASAQALMAQTDGLMGFRATGLAYVHFARQHPLLFRLMFACPPDQAQNPDLSTAATLTFEAMKASAAQVAGLRPDDPAALLAALRAWTIAHGLAHLSLDRQLDRLTPNVDALVEAVLDQFELATTPTLPPGGLQLKAL